MSAKYALSTQEIEMEMVAVIKAIWEKMTPLDTDARWRVSQWIEIRREDPKRDDL